jgi:hypothetical protein
MYLNPENEFGIHWHFMCYKKERKQKKNKKEKMHIQSILGTFNGKILLLNRELGMVIVVMVVNIR